MDPKLERLKQELIEEGKIRTTPLSLEEFISDYNLSSADSERQNRMCQRHLDSFLAKQAMTDADAGKDATVEEQENASLKSQISLLQSLLGRYKINYLPWEEWSQQNNGSKDNYLQYLNSLKPKKE